MKVDSGDESLDVAEAVGSLADGADFVVEPLRRGVGDSHLKVGEDSIEVLLHAFGGGDHGRQTAMGGPEVPAFEEALRVGGRLRPRCLVTS